VRRAQASHLPGAMLLPAAGTAAPGQGLAPGTVTGRLMLDGGPLGPDSQQPGTHQNPRATLRCSADTRAGERHGGPAAAAGGRAI